MDKKFAIFDMDGTLVDSMGYWNRLADEYLARFGLPGLSPALKEESIALTMLESAQLFIREFGLPGTPEQIAGEINALMEEHYRADVPLKPGAAELLARLKAAGVKMCVASSTHPALIDLCLRRLEVRDHFEFLLSCEEVGEGKNKPTVYLEAARRLAAKSPGVASDALCMLVVCNTASIQLIPTTVASVRAAEGCADPFDILPAVWLASALSVGVGIAACKIFSRVWRD